jgi:hypothetical protein
MEFEDKTNRNVIKVECHGICKAKPCNQLVTEEELEVYLIQDTLSFNRKKGNTVPLNVNTFLYERENTVI